MHKLFFAVFFIVTLFYSCDNSSNPCDKCTANQECISGYCIDKVDQCSPQHPDGVCQKGMHCENGECKESICSEEYPDGKCESEDQYCSKGVCKYYKCSSSHPNGTCENGEVCLTGGKCGTPTCSSSNTTGTCPNGQECISGKCETPPCSSSAPQGKCENASDECVNGLCLSKDRCTPENPDGVCKVHQTCIDGTCKDVACGENNPAGACPEGQYCNREPVGGQWVFSCKDVPTSCTGISDCPDGYKCEGNVCVEYVCVPECLEGQVCMFGSCRDDSFLCGVDSPNGWCASGYECIDGSCQVPVNNPCDDADCGNDYCIVTDWDDDNGYECVKENDLCSEENVSGKCNAPLVCQGGVCVNEDPCKNVTCDELMICNPTSGACVENYCKTHPDVCQEEHTICVNLFNQPTPYQCPCDIGYEYDFTQAKCVPAIGVCSNKNCGEGICVADNWADDGWRCVCNPGMVHLDENVQHLCIDPGNYNYCDGWDCGVGTCEEVTNPDGSKFAKCECPENFIFDTGSKTCVPGILCGNEICDNPLRQKCINNLFCEDQACSPSYPQGACGNAESCVDGACVLTEECSASTSAGYCMEGYSCKSGICCKGGVCTTSDGTLKQVGETCSLDTNNCVNDAICVPTPTGDGVCHKLCDQTMVNTCESLNTNDTVYHCVGRSVFDGVDYNKIGVCAVDENCSKFDNGGCNTNQVCLAFRNTNFTQCYAFEESTPLGASCTTGTTALGFNVGCAEHHLCVEGRCVPNCDNADRITGVEVNLCYEAFTQKYRIENLKVKDQGDLKFATKKAYSALDTCDPAASTCGNGTSCIKVQDKLATEGASKDVGVCSTSCNFNSTNYKAECSGNEICFEVNNNAVCLGQSACDPVEAEGCRGNETCYPVTPSLNACMTSFAEGHIGEACDTACQYGMCINGVCEYPCSIGDSSSCQDGETCEATTDAYLNNASHFGSPSTYGTCQ